MDAERGQIASAGVLLQRSSPPPPLEAFAVGGTLDDKPGDLFVAPT